ncbi:MAG: universal stress protein [Bacteroidia bacterium]|nr:universal stress protein [Bacteroidia bacterium]MBT8275453.1 universal stress protein [Bacteroidia bacterium]NNF30840.1 universal stress protein [Flavobacteriaceae bacterium]NNJ81028.1 universal stress protein [Flavobacteriaceae bacterium]NNK54453.1 universal stress protein [Flavobacteriaceae bacterium]
MKRILIPTDFSHNAWNAIEYTMAFFNKRPVHIHLYHIAYSGRINGEDDLYSNGVAIIEKGGKTKEKQLIALQRKIETLYPRTQATIDVRVAQSRFIEGIKSAVEELNIDLMVMGTKGASGLKEVTIGSHTGAVITRVKCPVLVIPERAVFESPKNIVFPTDFNMIYKQRILDTLFDVSDVYDSSIKVLRVANNEYPLNAEQEKNRNFLRDILEERSYSFHCIKSPRLEEGLQSFIDLMDVQIIAMVAKNLNFFQRLLFKPTVAKISYHTEIPFLVLHE